MRRLFAHFAALELISTLTCPHCGLSKDEEMPTDSCLFFYECTNCGAHLHPNRGDCCVFCSYGNVTCPSQQQEALGTRGNGNG